MTFIKLRSLILVASISLLSACSTFEGVLQEAASNVANEKGIEHVEPMPELDPLTLKAMQLREQPNQYQLNKTGTPVQAKHQFKQALALKRQGKLNEAQKQFLHLSEGYPALSGPWLQLADLSLLQAKPTEQVSARDLAVKQLEKALSLNPHNYFAHNRLAALLRQQGQFKQAELHYQKATASWPGFAEAYLNKGILYDLYLGNKKQALENYQLYQALVEESDRRVKGWIADLGRQIKSEQQEVAKQ
jgi:tetratricopeptide (TPR) repeat protein